MTIWTKLSFLALGVASVSSLSALTFTDVDVDGNEGEPDYQYMSSWGSSNGWNLSSWNKTFNLLNAGFDPLTMEIVSATVSFAFADDESDTWDYVQMSVGSSVLWDWQDVDGTHYNAPYSYEWFTTGLNSSVLVDLQDGVIDYSVVAQSGDYYLKEASLTVEVERRNLNVPDTGTTLGLLGLGIGGIILLRRQMKSGDV